MKIVCNNLKQNVKKHLRMYLLRLRLYWIALPNIGIYWL